MLIPLPLNSSTGNSCQVPPALCAGLQFTAPRSHPACTQIAPHSMFCPVTGTEFHHHPSHVSSDGVRSVPWGLQPTLHRQATADQMHLMHLVSKPNLFISYKPNILMNLYCFIGKRKESILGTRLNKQNLNAIKHYIMKNVEFHSFKNLAWICILSQIPNKIFT